MAREVSGFEDAVIEVPHDRKPPKEYGGLGDRGPKSTTPRSAHQSAPMFPQSIFTLGVFLGFSSSWGPVSVDTQVGSFMELDLANGYATTGDYMSAELGSGGNGKSLGGNVSAGAFLGKGGANGFAGGGTTATLGVTGPLGGGSVGYLRSTPDANGQIGFEGLSAAVNWSPVSSPVASSASMGGSKLGPERQIYNLDLNHHIMNIVRPRTLFE